MKDWFEIFRSKEKTNYESELYYMLRYYGHT